MKVKHLPYSQKLEEQLRQQLYQRPQFTGLYKSIGVQSAPISEYVKGQKVNINTIKDLIVKHNGYTFYVETIEGGTKKLHFTSLTKLDKWVSKNKVNQFIIA